MAKKKKLSRAELEQMRGARPGCRNLRTSNNTGTLVGLYNAKEADLRPEEGLYATRCEDHARFANHRTSALALDSLAHPEAWCPECKERGGR
jgi:hypothetical protein